jgi:hypothetical protein
MAGMVERRRWQCPKCGSRWDIPAGRDPKRCPKCKEGQRLERTDDPGERDFEAFAAKLSAESSAHGSFPKSTNGTAREAGPLGPVSSEPFFVPLRAEAPARYTPLASPIAARKRRRSSGLPVSVAVVACILMLFGLVTLQRINSRHDGASAEEARENIEVPESNPSQEESAITLAEFDAWFGREAEHYEFIRSALPGVMEQDNAQGNLSSAEMKRIKLRQSQRDKKWREIHGKTVQWQITIGRVERQDDDRYMIYTGQSGQSMLQMGIQIPDERVGTTLRNGDRITFRGTLDSLTNVVGLAIDLNITDARIVDIRRPGSQ